MSLRNLDLRGRADLMRKSHFGVTIKEHGNRFLMAGLNCIKQKIALEESQESVYLDTK